MRLSRFSAWALLPALAAAGWTVYGRAQNAPNAETAYRQAMETADLAIQKENKVHSELMKNEEYLTTEIGPRLTGGREMQAASAWTLQRFKDYGIDAHLETAQVPRAWYPGVDSAVILTPWNKVITIHAEAYSKTTCPEGAPATASNGAQNPACEITAPVMVLAPGQTPTAAEVKGKIVLRGAPASVNMDPGAVADNAYDSVKYQAKGVPAPGAATAGRGGFGGGTGPNPLDGAAAVLIDGGKPWGLMSIGSASRGSNGFSATPTAVITHEDYDLLYRMITDYHNPVSMRLALRGSLSAGPEDASITVAQIKGTEKPNEQVIIGGHLDSWFLGQGAVDNGTGAMAVLEAARVLHSLGWRPKRTLTFILFTGEEEGGLGVSTFIKNHQAEMPNIDAVLVDDTGTGRFDSISLDGFWETGALLQQVYTPLQEVFDMDALSSRTFGSSDHVAFERQGIPAYFGVQAEAHYREEHHTQGDTFNVVIPDQANQGAGVIAAWMWNVSQLDASFPHHAVQPAPPGRGGRGN